MDNIDASVSSGKTSQFVLWARIVGMAACFAWSFFILPPTNTFDTAFWGMNERELVRFLIVGAAPGLLISLADAVLLNRRMQRSAMWACCIARSAIMAVFLLAPSLLYGAAGVVAIALLGVANAFGLIAWGCSLLACEVGSCETSFVRLFAITGCLIVLFGFIPGGLKIALIVFPLVEALCFGSVCVGSSFAEADGSDRLGKSKNGHWDNGGTQEFSWKASLLICARTCCAVAFVAFSWAVFSNGMMRGYENLMPIMGVGFVAAAGLVWLFSHMSSNVGFSASVQWTLPLLAIGLALFSCESAEAIVLACLLFGAAQVGFEVMLRMQIIHSSKMLKVGQTRMLGFGYTSIMLGAFLGDVAYSAIASTQLFPQDRLIVFLAVAMVILSAVLSLGSRLRSNGDSNIPAKPCIDARISSSDATRRAHALSARFGLSKREEEIAEHLLEGRSRPYIRDELCISISTVNTHVRHIYEKVGVNSLQDLIDIAKSEDGR